jgi:hypothetical protein
MIGAPERIRTPDPQIRSLAQVPEKTRDSCKLSDFMGITSQWVSTSSANRIADPPPPEKKTAAPVGARNGGNKKHDREACQLQREECHAAAGGTNATVFDPLDAIAVYDGRTLLGYVHGKGDRWVAIGHDERRIGSFATRKLATRAVMEAHASPTNGGADV